MIYNMRKAVLLLVSCLLLTSFDGIPTANAGGGCSYAESYFTKNRVKSGETLEAVSRYWINDMPEKWYLDPEYAPTFFIDDEFPEFIAKSKFIEIDSDKYAVFKATITIPKSLQGNRFFQPIIYNVCGSETYERRGGQEGESLVILNNQKDNWCNIQNLDLSPKTVTTGQEFKVTFDLMYSGSVGTPLVEARYLDQIVISPTKLIQEGDTSRKYEATLKLDKPVRYNQSMFVRAKVAQICSGLGTREVNFTKIMLGEKEAYTSEVIEHGKVTLLGVQGACTKLDEKITVYETITKTVELTCFNAYGKTASWVTPQVIANFEAQIMEIKKTPCQYGSAQSNSYGKFVCGPRDGGFYFMTEDEFKIAIVKAQEEAKAKAEADAAAKLKAEEAAKAASAAKKITITCLKGKLIKKVTSVNPKCPLGYKKK